MWWKSANTHAVRAGANIILLLSSSVWDQQHWRDRGRHNKIIERGGGIRRARRKGDKGKGSHSPSYPTQSLHEFSSLQQELLGRGNLSVRTREIYWPKLNGSVKYSNRERSPQRRDFVCCIWWGGRSFELSWDWERGELREWKMVPACPWANVWVGLIRWLMFKLD